MTTRINLELSIDDSGYKPRTSIKADHQLYDSWDGEEPTEENFKYSASSLTSIYTKLYDIVQSNDLPRDAEYYIEDKLFAKMVDGYHLELNENIIEEPMLDPFRKTEEIEMAFTNEIEIVYGNNQKLEEGQIAVCRTDSIRAYDGFDSRSNNILNKEGKNVFNSKEEALAAIKDYYAASDANVSPMDKTIFKINDNENRYDLIMSNGKEVKPEEKDPSQKKKRTRGRRLGM